MKSYELLSLTYVGVFKKEFSVFSRDSFPSVELTSSLPAAAAVVRTTVLLPAPYNDLTILVDADGTERVIEFDDCFFVVTVDVGCY